MVLMHDANSSPRSGTAGHGFDAAFAIHLRPDSRQNAWPCHREEFTMQGSFAVLQGTPRTHRNPVSQQAGLRPELAAFFALAARQSRHGTTGEQRGILAELLACRETD
jgi:hypothetical protein